jgi:N-acetyl-gamma-glutamyl-phosphate reductase common form
MIRVGLIGARGYVGRELIGELDRSGEFELVYASSRALAGQELRETEGLSGLRRFGGLVARDLSPEEAAVESVDVVVLGLPNGLARLYVQALGHIPLIIDLSADHRHQDGWVYGSPELNGEALPGARRIANPGCYATAANLAVFGLLPACRGPISVFGVSGYSGAGTTPSPKNDPEVLKDNILPYGFGGHGHEGEIAAATGRSIVFAPHVASFFRGLIVTVVAPLTQAFTAQELAAMAEERFAPYPKVRVQPELPQLKDAAGTDFCIIGGMAVSQDGRSVTVSSVLDNLRKGAATQALENIRLALGS